MSNRDLNLDFVKGTLVIVMVVYHAMNYFTNVDASYYGYLRFINGSFVFLAGYVVSTFYDEKYGADGWQLLKRLTWRGIKLLVLFTALNLAISALGVTSYQSVEFGTAGYLANVTEIYGSGNGKLMAFQILIPISYVLLVAPLYFTSRWFRDPLVVVTLIFAFTYSFLDLAAPNLFFLLIGLVGLSVGIMLKSRTVPAIRSRVVIIIGISLCAVVGNALSSNVLTYSIGVLLMLKLIYDGATLIDARGLTKRMTVVLGQYSLVCYVAQIVFLFALYRILSKPQWSLGYELGLVIVGTCFALLGGCLLLTHCRRNSLVVDRAYRSVFA